MTWNPIFPAWILILVTLALVGLCVWGLVRAHSSGKRLGWLLRIVVAVLIGIACLRPGIGTNSAEAQQNDIDVLFVVDTTASMIAEDWNGAPRFDGVRADIAALAEHHAGARFSLITFDSSAQQRLPFTADATALQSVVETLRPEVTLYSNGSSVTIANRLTASVLEDAAEQNPERAQIVYYLGDGEQTAATPPESFADAGANADGGAVLGYGTAQGGKMLETLGGYSTQTPEYITAADGTEALSKIDEANLEAIAGQLGVPYQHRTPDTAPVGAAVDPQRLESQEGSDVETAFDLYWIFAIAAFLLLLREVWVNVRSVRELQSARGVSDDHDD